MIMSDGCRDCVVCTRSTMWRVLVWLVLWPLWGRLITMWTNLWRRRCPGCRHTLNHHRRRQDGSFMD